jgi:NAD(P)-dependent dehydrogenase (short-subunit alcohol dehydrogenase family)
MKRVFISGISRGVGKAYAEKFLASGWQVTGTSTSGQASLKHARLDVYGLDLSKPEQIAALSEKLTAKSQKFDVLINNAGVNLSSATEYPTNTLQIDVLRKTLEINLIGLADLTQRFIPLMASDGQIINVSSGAGAFHPYISTGTPSYQIAKAALNMYTLALATKMLKNAVKVWAFDPGWVRTDMGGRAAFKLPMAAAEELYQLVEASPAAGTFWTGAGERQW